MAQGYQATGPDGEGHSYDPNQPQTREQSTAPTSEASATKIGGVVYKYSAHDDKLEVETRDGRPAAATFSVPKQSGVSVMSAAGFPISLAEADKDSVIDLPGFGDTSIAAAVTQGFVRTRVGGGYELVPGMVEVPAPAEQKPDAPKPEAQQDEAISMEGVEGTSTAVDLTHKMLKADAGEAGYAGLVSAYLSRTDPSPILADIARSTGKDATELRAGADYVFSAYETAAKQVAAAQGVSNWDAFVQWGVENAPDAFEDATREMVESHSVHSLGRLARQYSRRTPSGSDWTVSQILAADMGNGIKSFERDGVAWLDIPGRGHMTFSRALAHGLIRIS
jgi:hypothetical protein